jgi:hypothetical protein
MNVPASYGLAQPITVGKSAKQPVLGFDAHSMVVHMWTALGKSVESRFFSHADWERARWELWYANQSMVSGRPTGSAWEAIQHGLGALLISPADKRRAAIELKPPGPDSDETAAVSMLSGYRDKLKPV